MMAEQKRNYGLDLLRILSMFMIVNLHVLGQGGAMVRIVGSESTYYAAWLIETCAYCAVDCYGLISGYVGVNGKFRPARFLELWLQVFFYSAGITLGYRIFAPDLLTTDSLWQAIFPVGWKTYWYFSAYAGLFFVMPYLNRLVRSLDDREKKRLAVVLFLVFSVGTAVPKANGIDFLQLVGGYSFVWLAVLYLLGACIRTCRFDRWKKRSYLIGYFGLNLFAWAFKILMENYTRSVCGEARYGRMFTGYAAPTMLLGAVCLVLLFEQLELKNKWSIWIVKKFSPLAFSVYLIHTQPLVWDTLILDTFDRYRYFPWPLLMIAVLLSAAGIYMVCTAIDYGRNELFRLLKVREKTEKLAGRLEHLWMKVFPWA